MHTFDKCSSRVASLSSFGSVDTEDVVSWSVILKVLSKILGISSPRS